MEKCLHRGRKRSGVWEEQLSRCALCQDVLKDPVSTSCGHWFCRQCSSSYWDQSASSGDPPCPQCGKRTKTVAANVGRSGGMASSGCPSSRLCEGKQDSANCKKDPGLSQFRPNKMARLGGLQYPESFAS
ncbi:unnamed protein product [Menidia menidia]|uniref:(Atlantic silverside) hypothetical protein n=1 Tax=Menidia menidia TaxID=238744 RepID=A0A8S4BT68_9TELE|nr:unnamed protein product [Menidia menidia]